MSAQSSHPTPSSVSWGIALAAAALLLIGGGLLVWSYRDQERAGATGHAPVGALALDDGVVSVSPPVARRNLPMPGAEPGLHSVAFAVENGTRVVKIKVLETGDELIVDAATGRLLEARPSRSAPVPPVGKFAAPFDPMT